VYGFLKVVMYVGVAAGLVAFFFPIDDDALGLRLPYSANNILAFGGLGLIVVGYVGRQLTKPES
jgi:hypothetical protein